MPYLILFVFILLFMYLPQLWVNNVLRHYNQRPERNFPGTGAELARHLLDKMGLPAVSVEVTEQGDHYDPQTKAVRLTRDKYEGKTLTAITVAAHEVGHAMQDGLDEPMFRLRSRLARFAGVAQKLGSFLLFASPFLGLIARAPTVTLVTVLAAFMVMGSGLLVHLITLPVELDASFNKALPMLKTGYLDKTQHHGAERILKAAALTYFAGALAGLLNFWRWVQVLRR